MSNVQIGHMVEFLGYEGNLPEEYRPPFKPGQTVRITDIAKNDAGDLLYTAASIDLKGDVLEDIPTETLFSDEFEVIEAGSKDEPESLPEEDYLTSPEDEIDLGEAEVPAEDPAIKAQHQGRNYRLHPITNQFRDMKPDEFAALREDIKQRGKLLVPIVVLPDNRIIDGKHRWQACQDLDITPEVTVYTGPQDDVSLYSYVCGLNEHRRQLDEDDIKAQAEERRARVIQLRSEELTQEQMAKRLKVSRTTIRNDVDTLKSSGEIVSEKTPLNAIGTRANRAKLPKMKKPRGDQNSDKNAKSEKPSQKQFVGLQTAWDEHMDGLWEAANKTAQKDFMQWIQKKRKGKVAK